MNVETGQGNGIGCLQAVWTQAEEAIFYTGW